MAMLNGSEILAKALKREGVEELFFLTGALNMGPLMIITISPTPSRFTSSARNS